MLELPGRHHRRDCNRLLLAEVSSDRSQSTGLGSDPSQQQLAHSSRRYSSGRHKKSVGVAAEKNRQSRLSCAAPHYSVLLNEGLACIWAGLREPASSVKSARPVNASWSGPTLPASVGDHQAASPFLRRPARRYRNTSLKEQHGSCPNRHDGEHHCA